MAATADATWRHRTGVTNWRGLYRVGAVVALVGVAGTLADIGLTMIPGWGTQSVPSTVPGWFAQLDQQPLLGLRNLDLLNAALAVVALPMYLAVCVALRRTRPAAASVALALIGLGTAAFVASNAALAMLDLAHQYRAASTDGDRLALLGAAAALLAQGAHASWGAFPGFLLNELGTLAMALSMWGGGRFSRRTAWVGALGAAGLIVYTTAITMDPHAGGLVMAVAVPSGLLMLTWNVLVARTLLRLAEGTVS